MVGGVVEGETDFVRDRASALPVGGIILVAVLGHLSLFPNVADLDGFYHIGHARAYLEGSLFDTSLPWATRSIIRDIGGDLWWGFHVLLLPFAAIPSVAIGLRIAAMLLTVGLGLTVLWVFRRHHVTHAGWWSVLFLIAVPNIFFRFLMVRPHVVSLAASIALLSVLVRGRWWQAALLAALMSWIHLNMFWVAPGLVVAYAIVRIPVTVVMGRENPDRGIPIRLALPAVLLGTLVGWLARPDPLATADLLNVQLVQLFLQKTLEAPLTFAVELSPIGIAELSRTSWLFAIGWIVAVVVLVRETVRGGLASLQQERGTLAITTMVVSGVFLFISLVSARRAMEQWVVFGCIALPFLLPMAHKDPSSRSLRAAVGVILGCYLAWGGWRHSLNVRQVAYPGDTLREVATFLAENSERGEVVFHTRWDQFGPLFAHNRHNRYLGGMDPIFQFAHDSRAYWEFFYLSVDATDEWTCDAWPCATGAATDTHQVLQDHFGAVWVVTEPRRNPRLSLYLLEDPRFELALETAHEAVFEVLDSDPPTSGEGG
jgi:hypothetical protein